MLLKQLQLKNFRCFTDKQLTFEHSIILIEGLNGTGKTSLLEALHYLCYLRSFRTHSPRELLRMGNNTFFIKAHFASNNNDADNEIQVGFSGAKRLVKINHKVIGSYKELMDHYRIVTLTEEDLDLIKGSPDVRRSFIDQALILYDPAFALALRSVRHIADSRNKMLYGGMRSKELYAVFTQQLWAASLEVQERRRQVLERLEQETQSMLSTYFDAQLTIRFSYKAKMMKKDESFEEFTETNHTLYEDEQRYGRSLFGAHLDDFTILYEHKQSKNYASRGQQKLIVLLIKIAQIRELSLKRGPSIFLLDDFMTDFDEKRATIALQVLTDLGIQLIFTAPARLGPVESTLVEKGAQKLRLD